MKTNGTVGLIVACTIVTAILSTLMMNHGWLVWIPALLALAVAARMCQMVDR